MSHQRGKRCRYGGAGWDGCGVEAPPVPLPEPVYVQVWAAPLAHQSRLNDPAGHACEGETWPGAVHRSLGQLLRHEAAGRLATGLAARELEVSHV